MQEMLESNLLNLAFADARSLAGMNSDIPAIRLAGD